VPRWLVQARSIAGEVTIHFNCHLGPMGLCQSLLGLDSLVVFWRTVGRFGVGD
jgi:hypothetical protein